MKAERIALQTMHNNIFQSVFKKKLETEHCMRLGNRPIEIQIIFDYVKSKCEVILETQIYV